MQSLIQGASPSVISASRPSIPPGLSDGCRVSSPRHLDTSPRALSVMSLHPSHETSNLASRNDQALFSSSWLSPRPRFRASSRRQRNEGRHETQDNLVSRTSSRLLTESG